MCVDVSKYLRYACGADCLSPNWSRINDRDQLTGYVEKLKRCKVGPEGQLSKLDVCVYVLADDKHPLHSQVTQTEAALVGWKATLRKDKRRLRKSRLQTLSSESLSLGEVSGLLECLSPLVPRQSDEPGSTAG